MKAFHEIRKYDSDFMVWHSSYTDISFLAHWHNEIEFIYVRNGEAQISIDDNIFTAHKGDLIICDSGSIHYSDSYEMKNSLDFIVFDPSVVSLSSVYESANFVHPLITSDKLEELGLTHKFNDLLNLVANELNLRDPYYKEIVTAKLMEFWYLLKRYIPRNTEKTSLDGKRSIFLYDMQQLLEYIDEHYNEPISLKFAADKLGFSESHFSKIFKKMMGINFVTYMNMVRIEHSIEMLKNSANKITDIAFSCGFNNIRSFNRVFKDITGVTPSVFLESPEYSTYNLTYFKRKTNSQQVSDNESCTWISNSEKL